MPKRTDIKSILIIGAIMSVVSTASFAITCPTPKPLLECLSYDKKKNDFPSATNEYRDVFYSLLQSEAKLSLKCESPKSTARFLDVVRITGNAELTELFHEYIEVEFALKSPQCLKDSFSLLSLSSQQTILDMLNNPLFIEQPQQQEIKTLIEQLKELSNA
jgi:hypothetical protein